MSPASSTPAGWLDRTRKGAPIGRPFPDRSQARSGVSSSLPNETKAEQADAEQSHRRWLGNRGIDRQVVDVILGRQGVALLANFDGSQIDRQATPCGTSRIGHGA